MHVLRNMVQAVRPQGLVLDLQVVRPNPVVEADGRVLCEVDGSPLFRTADPAAAAIDEMIASGALVEEARDVHEILTHFRDGNAVVEDFVGRRRLLPTSKLGFLRSIDEPCVMIERCLLRRLRVR